MKDYSETTENLRKHSFLIHSLVSSFIHRDQMNSGTNEGMQTIRKAAYSEILFVAWLPFALLP